MPSGERERETQLFISDQETHETRTATRVLQEGLYRGN